MISGEVLGVEALWFVMHHSDDPDRLAVACYLDESGTGGELPHAVVGGLVMNKGNFLLFDVAWDEILARHQIEPPLHMKEFGRPHGRFAAICDERRFLLFRDVSEVINSHKVYSVAATLGSDQFKRCIPEAIRNRCGLYGMCFLLCVFLNRSQAERMAYQKEIAYLFEAGNEHAGHVLEMHAAMLKLQNNAPLNVGTLTFEGKARSSLQAADVIAWGARRRLSGLPFKALESINTIFEISHHIEQIWPDEALLDLGQKVGNSALSETLDDVDVT